MNIVGIDFETTGTDAEKLKVTEVGAVIWDSETGVVKDTIRAFCYDESYPPLEPHIIDLTGITDEMLKAEGRSPEQVFERLNQFLAVSEYAVAYNKQFDEKTVYLPKCKQLDIQTVKTPWICAYTEVPYADKYRCRQLSHLAFDHGIKMDGRDLHRAVDDVLLMKDLLALYKWDTILAYANEPWVTVQAVIPAPWTDNGVGKAAATQRGYGWEKARGTDAPTFPKMWVKRIKEGALVKETNEAPFRIVKLT